MIEFKFLNLQYIYCVIYSIFGGECTEVEPIDTNGVSGALPDASLAGHGNAATATTTQSLDFWAWLFGGTGERAVSTGGVEAFSEPGIFEALVNGNPFFAFIGAFFGFIWSVYSAIAYTVSGILILLIIGAAVGLFLIRTAEARKYSTLTRRPDTSTQLRSRWQQLLDLAISTNPRDWREAILEADMMLGELLEKLGYGGDGTPERLRAIPEGAFVTLPNAWEAHRIRNFVAAKSSDYILTQREAFRIMKLYEQVFEEFDFV
jgi:hypothetical protein